MLPVLLVSGVQPARAQGAGVGLAGGVIRSEVNSSDDESQNVARSGTPQLARASCG
jgi:hypothetical protein